MLEQGVSDLLLANAGVAALIADRCYPVVPPAELQCWPALTIQGVSSAAPEFTLRGAQLNYSTLRITAWGKSFAACRDVLAAVDPVLNKFQGLLSDSTTRVLFAYGNSPLDHFDDVPRTFRTSIDYDFQFT